MKAVTYLPTIWLQPNSVTNFFGFFALFLAIYHSLITRFTGVAGVCSSIKYESTYHDQNAHKLEGKEDLTQQQEGSARYDEGFEIGKER